MFRSRPAFVLALAVVLAALASSATAAAVQTGPFPGAVESSPGQWVPCSHQRAIDAGRGCVASAPAPAPEPDGPPLVCDPRPDPDLHPELVNRCNAWPPAPDAVPAFLLGHVYAYDSGEVRARVVAIGLDVDGVQVVTVRRLADDGSDDALTDHGLTARRTPRPGGASVWRLVGGRP